MEIKVLGCYGGNDREHGLTSFLVNGAIAVDAGALTTTLSFSEQLEIDHIIISHIHFDHVCGLPFLVDNQFGARQKPLVIHASAEVIAQLRAHVFNDICWPDFSILPTSDAPSIIYREIKPGRPFSINGLDFEAVEVDHVVPALGLIVSEEERRWVYSGDTGVTKELWQRVNALAGVALLFVECSFPNRLASLAEESRHLTPESVHSQLQRLNPKPPVRVHHCKPIYLEEIRSEIARLEYPEVALLEQGAVFKI